MSATPPPRAWLRLLMPAKGFEIHSHPTNPPESRCAACSLRGRGTPSCVWCPQISELRMVSPDLQDLGWRFSRSAARSPSLEEQEVLPREEVELLHELESCLLGLGDRLRPRYELLGRVGRVFPAGWVVDDGQPRVLLHASQHLAIEIRAMGDVVSRVGKECQVDGIPGQHRIVFARNDGRKVAEALLSRVRVQV